MHRPIALAALLLLTFGLVSCDDADAPTIAEGELEASPQDVAGEATAAPTQEATEAPTQEATGAPTEAGSPSASEEPAVPPTFEEVCAGREDEAFIEVLTPQPDTEVGDPFTVTGCGNTFEANYLYRVELPDGTLAAEGFGTMTCGNGCVGRFEQDITVEATGEVTLVVLETSAEDGSEQHIVEVPLVVS